MFEYNTNTHKYITVSEITKIIKLLLKDNIGIVTIEGEVSNFKKHNSGHRYFSLKDDNSQLACTIWNSRPLNYELSDGMKVIATGSISIYPARGSYHLDVIDIKPYGTGTLYQAFEELKNKLKNLGYFDINRKKAIPEIIYNIGVSTSPTGAAVQDIFSTIKRRFPLATIYFRPTIVQGNSAAYDITSAIKELNETPAEIIIIGRGGGSIEDLWAYNTEIVADAIFKSSKPIISAVGHETDYSIADFVADLRAATPTAAAEIATPLTYDTIINTINNIKIEITNKIISIVNNNKFILKHTGLYDIHNILLEKIYNKYQNIDSITSFIQQIMNNIIKLKKLKLEKLITNCELSNPIKPLDRGFALLKHNNIIINNYTPLTNFKTIDIVRKQDITKVKVLKK